MNQGNVFLQVLLRLRINPFLEVNEVKGMVIMDSLRLKPLGKKWEIFIHFFPVEYPVYHVATEQPHLYFVPHMAVDVLVLVNVLENVRCCSTVRKLQLVKHFLAHCRLVPLIEILYWHVSQNPIHLIVRVLVHYVSLHIFFFQL